MNNRHVSKVNNKLRSRAGESIAETLVALLIAALALVMLAGAIAAASHMITRSREKLRDYYDANECLVNESVPQGTSSSIASEDTNNKTITISVLGHNAGSATSVVAGGTVKCIHNNVFSNNVVTTYKFVPDND